LSAIELTDPVCSAKFLVNGRDYGSRWYIAFSKLYQESISFFIIIFNYLKTTNSLWNDLILKTKREFLLTKFSNNCFFNAKNGIF